MEAPIVNLPSRSDFPGGSAHPLRSPFIELATWLDEVLRTLIAGATVPWQAEEIRLRLKDTKLDAVLFAIERARPRATPRQELELYRHWIAANEGAAPLLHAAWFNMGILLSREGDVTAAVAAYSNALALRPDFHGAAINLGLLLEENGRPEQALLTWKQAMQPDEVRVALDIQQGRLLETLGRLDEAEQMLRRVLLVDPSQPDVLQHYVHIRQKVCAWPIMPSDIPGLSGSSATLGCGPLGIMASTDDVGLQREVAAAWITRKMEPAPRRLAPLQAYGHRRIRLGYMSSDFCKHAMSYLVTELFERHDRSRFEVFGYCSSQDDGSELRQRVLAAFDHHRFIRTLSDEQAAQVIRDDEIDVLVDLNGLTVGTRLAVMRWRPAPIQATYLGYVGPVPLPELDYLFCDETVVPPDLASSYQPKPLPIAGVYQANDSKRTIGPVLSRADAGLPDDRFVLCCFSRHYKVTEAMFGAWMSILQQAERAVLWLAMDNPFSLNNLRAAAQAAGIAEERLIFSERTSPDLYVSRLALADLFVDTFPYNAGTVASDAIRMQLPLVTLSGDAFASRMAMSLLRAVGADEGITTTLHDYVALCVRLATDPVQYQRYKARFTSSAWHHRIGDIAGFTADYEATLRRLVQGAGGASGPMTSDSKPAEGDIAVASSGRVNPDMPLEPLPPGLACESGSSALFWRESPPVCVQTQTGSALAADPRRDPAGGRVVSDASLPAARLFEPETAFSAPLNKARSFEAWPHFNPGQRLDSNPSFVRLDDGVGWAVLTRYAVPPRAGSGSIWAVRVDGEMQPLGVPQAIVADGIDPRMVRQGDRVLLFYVLIERDVAGGINGSSVVLAEFRVSGERWEALGTLRLPKRPIDKPLPAGAQPNWAKNWVPFVIDDTRVGLIYSHEPWDVLTLQVGRDQPRRFEAVYGSPGIRWNYGTIHGGTPPVHYDEKHLVTFFHASQMTGSRTVYSAGACVFLAEAPFTPVGMTAEPVLIAPYRSGMHRFGWPLAGSMVVPLGCERVDEGYRLLCGCDNGSIVPFLVRHEELTARLGPVDRGPGVHVDSNRGGMDMAAPRQRLLCSPAADPGGPDLPIVNFLRVLAGRGRTFVDVGARIGAYTMELAPRFDRVIAFEPSRRPYHWLCHRRALNGYAQVACVPIALGETAGDAVLSVLSNDGGRDTLLPPAAAGGHAILDAYSVPVETLDSRRLRDVDLLRIDVEGFELPVLRGAAQTVTASRPVILMRVRTDIDQRRDIHMVLAALEYTFEFPFPLSPELAICLPIERRGDYDWFM